MTQAKKHKYSSSSQQIAAIRALGYEGQYRVCYAFYDEIIKYSRWDNNRFGQLFDFVYEGINPDALDEEILRIRQCVNEMDNVLSEMDSKDPGAFLSIERVLASIIGTTDTTEVRNYGTTEIRNNFQDESNL